MSQESSLKDLIPVVNKLQDLVSNTIGVDTLDLPQVVVVGSQSSGKSSVLENIVGRDFLPRGTGIVTRRPLILQLINLPEGTTGDSRRRASSNGEDADAPAGRNAAKDGSEWGEFLHIPKRKFYDFDEIRDEIASETARIAGSNKGINKLPINLKIYSPKVLNLTLVDLPGITKVPIGDQPTDIEKQTKELVLQYVTKPNSLILAVSPANQDLVNSEALKLARKVDPHSKRTIGVLTKLDLMDRGTNALDILNGTVYPLRLGFIGTVNRSQQDIQDEKSMSDSLLDEKTFFQQHPAYRSIAHKCGTNYLARMLNQTLMTHIRERLPDIKARLNAMIGQTQQELAAFGPQGGIGVEGTQGTVVLGLMTKFAAAFVASIDGSSPNVSTKELGGGARIYYIFNDIFTKSLADIDPVAALSHHDVLTAIRNSSGPRASLFVPEQAFEALAKPQIRQLEGPAHRCVELVYEELMKICHGSGAAELERFPRLQGRIIETLSQLLNERLGPTSSFVSNLIDINTAYINTNHPDFLGAAEAMASVIEDNKRRDVKNKSVVTAIEELSLNGRSPSRSRGVSRGRHAHTSSTASSSDEGSTSTSTANGETLVDRQEQRVDSPVPRETFLNYFFGNTASRAAGPVPSSPGASIRASMPRSFAIDRDFAATLAAEESENAHSDITGEISPRERLECDLLLKLIRSYFDIVRESIADQVPKAIMHMLVNYSKEAAQNRLVTDLYKENLFPELLYEDESIVQERRRCQETLETYRTAAKVINEVI